MQNVIGLAEMRRRLTGYSVSIAISAVANLRIADFLSERPMTSAELAGLSGSDEQFLRRLLQFLASEQVFEELEGDVFALTEQSRWLRSDVPGSLRPRAVFAGCALNWMAWGSLLGSVKTGKSAIQLTFGETLFDHLKSNPTDANVFNTFMAEQTAASVESILSAYSFSGVREIVDVGGGHGALVAGVLRSYADLRGVLFDTPEVVASAAPFLDRAGVIDRCRLMGGDFFNEMPTGSDLYALKFILHDWPDAEADTFPFHPTEFSKPQLEAFHRVGRTCDDDANPLHGAPPSKRLAER
jgi:orsellinic acid C2-O-methyltransferase